MTTPALGAGLVPAMSDYRYTPVIACIFFMTL